MLFDFFKESLSFYTYDNDVFPVKITDIKDEVDTNKQELSGKPSYYLIGYRIDNPTFVVTIVHPFRYSLPVFVGDYVLVRKLSAGFYLLLGKLNERVRIFSGDGAIFTLNNPSHRSVLPQFYGKNVSGTIYNENTIYATYISSYIKKEKDYLRKRFIEFPSYDIYRSFYDIFQYDSKLWDILNDKNEDVSSREAIFSLALSPVNKEEFWGRNKEPGFTFRPDVVFDVSLFSDIVHKDEPILKSDKKLLFPQISINQTDKYPYLFFFDKSNSYKFVSYDEILKTADDVYDYQIFYPFEYRETRLGRNKLGFYKFSENEVFAVFKSSFDQQVAFLKTSEFYQTRIRNKQNSILLEETNSFSRTILSNYHSSTLELLSKHNLYSYVFGIVAGKQVMKSLQEEGSPISSNYSFFLLKNNSISDISRIPQNFSDGVYSVVLQSKTQSENSLAYFILNSYDSFASIKGKVGSSQYIEIVVTNEDTCFVVKNWLGKYVKFCEETTTIKEDLIVERDSIIQRDLSVNRNLTVSNGTTTLNTPTSINGNVTINGTATINGKIAACFSGSTVVPC